MNFNRILHRALKVALSISLLCATGCAQIYKPYRQSTASINYTDNQIMQIEKKELRKVPPVMVLPDYYVDTDPVDLTRSPSWMSQSVDLRSGRIPLDQLLKFMLRNTPAVVSYQAGVAKHNLVSLYYSGSIRGALDKLSGETGYHYKVKGNHLAWNAFVTKTFDISFMPGATEYMVGQTAASQAGDETVTQTGTVIKPRLNKAQFSNLKGQLSVWKDLERTLDKLKSQEGKVVISEATTSVTVTDIPANVLTIQRYIEHLNKTLSKQVSIRVQVLEVDLNRDFSLGIDWDLIAKRSGQEVFKYQTGNFGNIVNLTSTALANSVEPRVTPGSSFIQLGRRNNARIFFQALNEQGRVRIVTQPSVVTTNNQLAEIQITQDRAYLESVSTTFTGVEANVPTTSLTPGVVTDGFTLFVLPKIQDRKVYMQIAGDLSNLIKLEKIDNAPTNRDGSENPRALSNNQGQFQSIQVPTVIAKHFNQRAVVPSGTTLVITGFKQLKDQTQTASIPGGKVADLLASRGSLRDNIQIIVLITPTILEDGLEKDHYSPTGDIINRPY